MVAMTEEEYLVSKGVGSPFCDYTIDKIRGNRQLRTQRGQDKFFKECNAAINQYAEKRSAARAAYKALVESGEVRDKTFIERAMEKAQGYDECASVQAARRILAKKGIDWRTGKLLKEG